MRFIPLSCSYFPLPRLPLDPSRKIIPRRKQGLRGGLYSLPAFLLCVCAAGGAAKREKKGVVNAFFLFFPFCKPFSFSGRMLWLRFPFLPFPDYRQIACKIVRRRRGRGLFRSLFSFLPVAPFPPFCLLPPRNGEKKKIRNYCGSLIYLFVLGENLLLSPPTPSLCSFLRSGRPAPDKSLPILSSPSFSFSSLILGDRLLLASSCGMVRQKGGRGRDDSGDKGAIIIRLALRCVALCRVCKATSAAVVVAVTSSVLTKSADHGSDGQQGERVASPTIKQNLSRERRGVITSYNTLHARTRKSSYIHVTAAPPLLSLFYRAATMSELVRGKVPRKLRQGGRRVEKRECGQMSVLDDGSRTNGS